MLQLAELDRLAGSILEEERAVTRILVLCALGDEAEARSAAQALGAASRVQPAAGFEAVPVMSICLRRSSRFAHVHDRVLGLDTARQR